MITKDMRIAEVVSECPDTMMVFLQYGLGCVGCQLAHYETIEEGALAHGIDVDQLVADLNAVVEEAKGKAEKEATE